MIGGMLGPYRIDRELGSGGMGKVYAAVVAGRCPGLDEGTRVALKVVHPHLLETPGFFKRFLREGEIGKSVRHENVVATFDCDQLVADGVHQNFLAMEYVEGQTLRELLDELERVPEELCRHIAREVCKGLRAIHAAGVIHRDMKPDNVLITEDHVVKVMDLGVAQLARRADATQPERCIHRIGRVRGTGAASRSGSVECRRPLPTCTPWDSLLYELVVRTATRTEADSRPRGDSEACPARTKPRRLGDVNPQLSAVLRGTRSHTLLAKQAGRSIRVGADELLAVLEEGEESDWWNRRACQGTPGWQRSGRCDASGSLVRRPSTAVRRSSLKLHSRSTQQCEVRA